MQFQIYTIVLTETEAALCRKTAHLWGDVPAVKAGPNKLKKPEWSRVMMSLEQYTFRPQPDRHEASVLAGKIYRGTETHRCEVETVTVPDPVPAPKKESQGSLF